MSSKKLNTSNSKLNKKNLLENMDKLLINTNIVEKSIQENQKSQIQENEELEKVSQIQENKELEKESQIQENEELEKESQIQEQEQEKEQKQKKLKKEKDKLKLEKEQNKLKKQEEKLLKQQNKLKKQKKLEEKEENTIQQIKKKDTDESEIDEEDKIDEDKIDKDKIKKNKINKKLNVKSKILENAEDNNNTKNLKNLLNQYLQSLLNITEYSEPELEIRFESRHISKIIFYNIIKSLLNNNFKLNNEKYSLKIILNNEYSNIRTEITELPNIQYYCKYNNISGIDIKNLNFVQKTYLKNEINTNDDNTNVNNTNIDNTNIDKNNKSLIYIDDFDFKASFQIEKKYKINDEKIKNIIDKWNTTKKIFRYIKRFEYTHPDYPFSIHCSIVKTSKTNYRKLIPQFNIKDSEVFNSLENYEIEIEFNNELIIDKYSDGNEIYNLLKKTIKYVLIGIQQTSFPITIPKQKEVIYNYIKLIKNMKELKPDYRILNNDFIGPSSVTIQMINLLPINEINDTNRSVPNIRNNYTVTDKADGIRKLLFINNDGYIYLIPMSMNVEFTGCYTDNKLFFNSILDGEHVLYDKKGNYINLYASFDIYYVNAKNVTSYAFAKVINNSNMENSDINNTKITKITKFTVNNDDDDDDDDDDFSNDKSLRAKTLIKEQDTLKDSLKDASTSKDIYNRLAMLNNIIKNLKLISVTGKNTSFNIRIKKFYADNIFNSCKTILNNIKEGLYEYNTDGIILTPANTGVASNTIGKDAPNYKVTWNECFKWKPPEFNTIDFLIKIKKNEFGANEINYIYSDGINLQSNEVILSYYTLILYVGFSEKRHGYINPFNDLINNNINYNKENDKKDDYKPARFYPTNPYDEDAGICYISGIKDDLNNLKIFTEEGEEIEDNTIIEFKYELNKEKFWRWVPLRVRYDKTSELRSGIKNFGNVYNVANSNWQSIHNPITEHIITTGRGIKLYENEDIYYNKTENNISETKSLRDFHNLYVKNILINKTSNPGNILIDYACGKAGDLSKWINAKLEFVLGIDLSKDNIENRLDGACARYLNNAAKYKNIPKAIFVYGNTSLNIKSGEAFTNEKNKLIVKAILGEGVKNEISLGKAVYKNYGIGKNGFNVSSIQFALHYMFESKNVLNEFLKNISENTMINGYFIGCCYDGEKVFNMLNKEKTITIFKNSKKIFEINKKYENKEFKDDDTSIGYAIDVYQETINKVFREYLVNFNYLNHLMENYGFVLLNMNECKELDIPKSVGDFEELYELMKLDMEKDKLLNNRIGQALNMSDEEKKISFLNKYFIYKKVRNITDYLNLNKEIDLTKDINAEFQEIDKSLETIERTNLTEKSKKLEEEFLKEEKKMKETLKELITKEEEKEKKKTRKPRELKKDKKPK